MKERIDEIPYIRGIAFLAVVMQHSLGSIIFQPNLSRGDVISFIILLHLAKFAVPAFIMITGLVLFYNYPDKLDYLDFMKKRFKDIIVPYLLWTAIYFWCYEYTPQGIVPMLKQYLFYVISGTGCYHLWFVVMIFQFYLFFPVSQAFVRAIRPYLTSFGKVFAALTVALVAYLLILNAAVPDFIERLHISPISTLFVEYRDRNMVYWFFYFLLGSAAGLTIRSWRVWIDKVKYWNFILFLLLLGWVSYLLMNEIVVVDGGYKADFNFSSPLKASMALFSVSSLILLYAICVWISGKHNKATLLLKKVGDYSYGCYLIHVLILSAVGIWVYPHLSRLEPIVLWAVLFIGCTIGSIAGTYLLANIPIARALVGAASKRKRSAS